MSKQKGMRLAGLLLLAGLFLTGLLHGLASAAAPPVTTAALPLDHLLDENGELQLAGDYVGSVDPAGWQLSLDDQGRPFFTPASPTATGAWATAYGAPGVDVGFGGVGVYALAVDSQGRLYVGGNFEIAGDQNIDNLALWDGNDWLPVGQGVNGDVRALAIDASDNLYVGGTFNQVSNSNGTSLSAGQIARWDGASWSLLGDDNAINGNGLSNAVYALTIGGDGTVYAGGLFTTAYDATGSNVSANRVAAWDGTGWHALGADSGTTGNGVNSTVQALAIRGSTLYVGGLFTTAYNSSSLSHSANRVAAWDTAGGSWSALGADSGLTGNGLNADVNALVVADNGDLYAGGLFTAAYDAIGSNVSASRVARWNGSSWSGSLVASGVNGGVNALALLGDELIVAGGFTHIVSGNVAANFSARYNTISGSWTRLGNDGNSGDAYGNGLDRPVVALATGNGGVYVGGLEGPFRAYNSLTDTVSIESIAFWQGTGQWTALANSASLGANPDGSHGVRALAVDGEGNLYVAGSFTAIGNLSVNRIARWDGTTWSRLGADGGDAGNGLDDTVYALAFASNGDLYAGGAFRNAYPPVATALRLTISPAGMAAIGPHWARGWQHRQRPECTGPRWPSPAATWSPPAASFRWRLTVVTPRSAPTGLILWDGANWTALGPTAGVAATASTTMSGRWPG
ncbi:MAG: hypothetical protein H6651_19245 [Ardenticatenales bacterium]|nr:hypothetical protein [Ardenticatenales bacterium]